MNTQDITYAGQSYPVQYRPGTMDEGVLDQINRCHDHDLSRLPFWDDILRFYEANKRRDKPLLIVDGGAHIGIASVWFHLMFPQAKILAYELNEENFKVLQENTRKIPQMLTCNQALMGSSGFYQEADPGQGNWGFRATAGETGKAGVTLDRIYGYASRRHIPFIVKLDVEGEEENILRNHAGWLSQTPVVMVECHNWVKDWSVFDVLRHGRECQDMGANVISVDRGLLGA